MCFPFSCPILLLLLPLTVSHSTQISVHDRFLLQNSHVWRNLSGRLLNWNFILLSAGSSSTSLASVRVSHLPYLSMSPCPGFSSQRFRFVSVHTWYTALINIWMLIWISCSSLFPRIPDSCIQLPTWCLHLECRIRSPLHKTSSWFLSANLHPLGGFLWHSRWHRHLLWPTTEFLLLLLLCLLALIFLLLS